jgi:hypothetical protein
MAHQHQPGQRQATLHGDRSKLGCRWKTNKHSALLTLEHFRVKSLHCPGELPRVPSHYKLKCFTFQVIFEAPLLHLCSRMIYLPQGALTNAPVQPFGQVITAKRLLTRNHAGGPNAKFKTKSPPGLLLTCAAKFSDKSGDTCGNFLRLVRPTGLGGGRLASTRRKRPFVLVAGRFRGICGNCLRPAPPECPCFRRHVAIARTAHLGPRGRHPVQFQ